MKSHNPKSLSYPDFCAFLSTIGHVRAYSLLVSLASGLRFLFKFFLDKDITEICGIQHWLPIPKRVDSEHRARKRAANRRHDSQLLCSNEEGFADVSCFQR